MKVKNNTPPPEDSDGTIAFKIKQLRDWIEIYVSIYDGSDHGKLVGYNESKINALTDYVIRLVEKDVVNEWGSMKKCGIKMTMRGFCKYYSAIHKIPAESIRSTLKRAGCY